MEQTTPTTIVIFGATGDLFRRKLSRALFDLYRKFLIKKNARFLGFSRRPWDDEAFRRFVASETSLAEGGGPPEEFLARFHYVQGDLGEAKSYERLAERLAALDKDTGRCSNKLLYLATPPSFYEGVLEAISNTGLAVPCAPGVPGEELVWNRILIEKPFGKDLAEATRLDRRLGELFAEEQVFRIDHYLAKETVQNILTFRFSNRIFEPLWSGEHIARVVIRLNERGVVADRGPFYDGLGALRDVGQNHLLVMLALVAMEHPGSLAAEHIRRARADILRSLRPAGGEPREYAVRGQYEGYRREKGVAPDSATETFFRLTLSSSAPRWSGVPFVIESGKGLSETRTDIAVHFKPPERCACPAEDHRAHPNILRFTIQPDEGIEAVFWAKRPGFDFVLEPQRLSFKYAEDPDRHELPDAYERVLLDAVRGDQTLFSSTEEVDAAWRLMTPILAAWHSVPLAAYPVGTDPRFAEHPDPVSF